MNENDDEWMHLGSGSHSSDVTGVHDMAVWHEM